MIQMWVDGGTGPGNGTDQTECYGSVLLKRGKTETLHSRHPFPDIKTNNEAEYRALLIGLDRAYKGEAVRVFSDSRLIVNQVNGKWKCNYPHLQSLLTEVWKTIARQKLDVSLTWVPRAEIVEKLGH